jgi:hypothetical protein
MKKSNIEITEQSKTLIKELLGTKQLIHEESLFRDDLFEATCEKLAGSE